MKTLISVNKADLVVNILFEKIMEKKNIARFIYMRTKTIEIGFKLSHNLIFWHFQWTWLCEDYFSVYRQYR